MLQQNSDCKLNARRMQTLESSANLLAHIVT